MMIGMNDCVIESRTLDSFRNDQFQVCHSLNAGLDECSVPEEKLPNSIRRLKIRCYFPQSMVRVSEVRVVMY